jgi:hypothetical protein
MKDAQIPESLPPDLANGSWIRSTPTPTQGVYLSRAQVPSIPVGHPCVSLSRHRCHQFRLRSLFCATPDPALDLSGDDSMWHRDCLRGSTVDMSKTVACNVRIGEPVVFTCRSSLYSNVCDMAMHSIIEFRRYFVSRISPQG